MTILTRQMLIDKLRAAAVSASTQQRTGAAGASLASWAFDQFYAEEEGSISFEPGYRRVIGAAIDDVMFSDQPGFQLSADDLAQMIDRLEQATPSADESDDEDEDEDDRDDVELE